MTGKGNKGQRRAAKDRAPSIAGSRPTREQRKIDLPAGWFERLEEIVHTRGWDTIDDFCEDPNDRKNGLKISMKTLERSRAGNEPRMTIAKFDVLRQKLELPTRGELLHLLSSDVDHAARPIEANVYT